MMLLVVLAMLGALGVTVAKSRGVQHRVLRHASSMRGTTLSREGLLATVHVILGVTRGCERLLAPVVVRTDAPLRNRGRQNSILSGIAKRGMAPRVGVGLSLSRVGREIIVHLMGQSLSHIVHAKGASTCSGSLGVLGEGHIRLRERAG